MIWNENHAFYVATRNPTKTRQEKPLVFRFGFNNSADDEISIRAHARPIRSGAPGLSQKMYAIENFVWPTN